MPVIADLVPDYVPGMTAISRIHVLPFFRRLGYGTDVMNQICRSADLEEVTLCLEINPYGEMTYEQLASWYEKFGFAKDDSREGLYIRKPKDWRQHEATNSR
jgi:ribosomal protein S18 acetylase RimI-like enzyme